MTSPLARPPFGAHLKPPPPDNPPAPNNLGNAVGEVLEALAQADWRRTAWHAAALLPDFALPRVRARMLAAVGCDVQRGVGVLGFVHLIGPPGSARNLHVGAGSVIGPGARFCLDGEVFIGANVSIGPGAMLYTATHLIAEPSRRMHPQPMGRRVVIEDGAWIALGALVLPGVRVGRGAVVAAGAVVGTDVPDNVLVAGNPATVVQDLPRPSHPATETESETERPTSAF